MTEKSNQHRFIAKPQFNGSLTRTVILALLILTILPVGILAVVTYSRSISLIRNQVSQQIITISNTYAVDMETLAAQQISNLKTIFYYPEVITISFLLDPKISTDERFFYENNLNETFKELILTQATKPFDHIVLLNSAGEIVASSNENWMHLDIAQFSEVRQILNSTIDENHLYLNFGDLYPNQLISVTSKPYLNSQGNAGFLIGFSRDETLNTVLKNAISFYPGSKGYYQSGNTLYTLQSNSNLYEGISPNLEQQIILNNFTNNRTDTEEIQINDQTYLAYSSPIDGYQAALVFAVPEQVYLKQVQELGPMNLFILLNLVMISILIVYGGTTQLVNPLIHLADKANKFAQGDWNQRAEVNRRDEIGLLGFSFNQMVEQLSGLYRSLEEKVESRTRQMITASEIAQNATSASTQEEILQNACSLVNERFGFTYTAIYLVDSVFNYARLKAFTTTYTGSDFDSESHNKFFVPLNVNSVLGDVIKNQSTYATKDVETDTIFHYKGTIISNTRSLAQIPIKLNDQVIGVLDVQSNQVDMFESELVNVLEALASQIATGLRNIATLETAQVDLAETNILYQTTRQIAQFNNEIDVLDAIKSAIEKTDYITAIFSVAQDHLKLNSLSDKEGKMYHSNLAGITIPFKPDSIEYLKDNLLFVSDDLENSKYFDNLLLFLNRRGCLSTAIIPIMQNKEPVKLIVLGSRIKIDFTQRLLQPYVNLAEVSGSSLEKIDYINQIEKRLQNLEMLEKTAKSIADEDDMQLIFHATHQLISNQYGSNANFLFALFNSETRQIEIPFMYENNEIVEVAPFPLGEGLTSYIIQNNKSLLLPSNIIEKSSELGIRILGKPAKSWVGVPLETNEQVIGALILQDMETENRFGKDDLELLETLAPQVSASILNATRIHKLRSSIQGYELERFLLKTLLENIPEHITFKDLQGKYIQVSTSFAKDVNTPIESIVGGTDSDIFGATLANEYYATEQEIMMSATPMIGHIESDVDDHGNLIWYQHNKLPMITDSGQTIGILNITENITVLKQAEDLAQKRADQIQTASEIARDTAGTLDLDELLAKAVNLVRERFGFYHASIFLLDTLGEYAILRESTGDAGVKMKAARHRLAVGSQSTVGSATATVQPVVNNDVTQSANYYPNPLLPDTRSELAIPLKVGNRVLGALDVQSTTTNAFQDEDIRTLQILSDQLATAILNANLFIATQEHLSKHRILHQITSAAAASNTMEEVYRNTVEGLLTAMPGIRLSIYTISSDGSLLLQASAGYENRTPALTRIKPGHGIIGNVSALRNSIRVTDSHQENRFTIYEQQIRSQLAVPIQYTDHFYGVLNLESLQVAAFDDTDQEIITTLGTSLGSILSVTQLVEQIRRQVNRQRQLYEITNKLRRSVDMENIIETSAKEIARVLGASRTKIHIALEAEKPEIEINDDNQAWEEVVIVEDGENS
jgi:PAS domain S-box-containing protein